MAGYTGEFIFCSFFYLAQLIFKFQNWQSTEIRFRNFFYPAALDFCDNIALVIGLSLVFPSFCTMSKALVVPMTAFLCKLFINKAYSQQQVNSIVIIVIGVITAGVASFFVEEDQLGENIV